MHILSDIRWYERHESFVNAKTFKSDTRRYWFTHRNVRKAFIHIRRALPDMFHYLDNPNIPKTTNYFLHHYLKKQEKKPLALSLV
jgi:hypothetical protein